MFLWTFVVIWYISPRFGMLYQEKSGNPGCSSYSAGVVIHDFNGGLI
jgi:hypothetical protein